MSIFFVVWEPTHGFQHMSVAERGLSPSKTARWLLSSPGLLYVDVPCLASSSVFRILLASQGDFFKHEKAWGTLVASFWQCPSSPVLESGPDVGCHMPSSVQGPTWDTFSFFLPLPTSLFSLLSVSFHSASPNSFSSSWPCGQLDHVSGRRLPDSLSSRSTFLTSQSILQPVRVTETLSYLGSRSVFTAALGERERESCLCTLHVSAIKRGSERCHVGL